MLPWPNKKKVKNFLKSLKNLKEISFEIDSILKENFNFMSQIK